MSNDPGSDSSGESPEPEKDTEPEPEPEPKPKPAKQDPEPPSTPSPAELKVELDCQIINYSLFNHKKLSRDSRGHLVRTLFPIFQVIKTSGGGGSIIEFKP